MKKKIIVLSGDINETDISGNGLSGNGISGNGISGNGISGNGINNIQEIINDIDINNDELV